jgi:cellulose synthase/poly-beta-1,6-N-acetylglucosamine synthase-like glycosyltransferase
MTLLLSILLWIGAWILLVPAIFYVLECLIGLLPPRPLPAPQENRPALAVVIPAHNEASTIGATLATVTPQLGPGDGVLVVADNCDDSTADAARAAGAHVVERRDPDRRGKGYALDFAVRELEVSHPDARIVVVLDADASLAPGSLEALAQQTIRTGRPAQAAYLMVPPAGDESPRSAVSALAVVVKNLARPAGLARVGLPMLLTGSGMAFPRDVIRTASLADGNIVEDMALGLALAIDGAPPHLCEQARVTSELPAVDHAARSQRTRWEHGHLATMRAAAPTLLVAGLSRFRLDLLALALELSVPPLSMLVVLLLAGAGLGSIVSLVTGASIGPALALLAATVWVGVATLLAWSKWGSAIVPARALAAVPSYVLWKIPVWIGFARAPQKEWVRTERPAEAAPSQPAPSRPAPVPSEAAS